MLFLCEQRGSLSHWVKVGKRSRALQNSFTYNDNFVSKKNYFCQGQRRGVICPMWLLFKWLQSSSVDCLLRWMNHLFINDCTWIMYTLSIQFPWENYVTIQYRDISQQCHVLNACHDCYVTILTSYTLCLRLEGWNFPRKGRENFPLDALISSKG